VKGEEKVRKYQEANQIPNKYFNWHKLLKIPKGFFHFQMTLGFSGRR
jgi:hypothetical protein